MQSKQVRGFAGYLLLAAVGFALFLGAPDDALADCSVGTDSYSEDFSDISTQDTGVGRGGTQGWGSGGPITLPFRTGTFPPSSQSPANVSVPDRLVSAFTDRLEAGAGPQNFITLSGSEDSCVLRYYGIDTSTAYYVPDLSRSVVIATGVPCPTGTRVTAGSVSGSGADDVLVISPSNMDFDGSVNSAVLYVNDGTGTSWRAVDVTSPLSNANVQTHASGSRMVLKDVNRDGLDDLHVLTGHGVVQQLLLFNALGPTSPNPGFESSPRVLIDNLGFSTPIAGSTRGASTAGVCAGSVGLAGTRGPTGLVLADFDGDGIYDVVVSSASDQNLHFYHGLRDNRFVRGTDIPFPPGGIQFMVANDFDIDGTIDIAAFRGALGCGGGTSGAWILFNQANTGSFVARPIGEAGKTDYVDWATIYRRPHNDANNLTQNFAADVYFGKTISPGYYNIWSNTAKSGIYNTSGVTYSDPYSSSSVNFISATLSVPMTQPTGTAIDFYISPDNGDNYEYVTVSELSGSSPHNFHHLGNQFIWRANFRSLPATLTLGQTSFIPAAKVSPSISRVSVSFVTQTQPASISRGAVSSAAIIVGGSTSPTTFTYSPKFDYPGWAGHLVAYNVGNNGNAQAGTISTLDVSPSWDGGNLLIARSAASRTMFTGYSTGPDFGSPNLTTTPLARAPFTSDELTSPTIPAVSPNLRMMMQLPPAYMVAAMNQLRSGVNGSSSVSQPFKEPGHTSARVVSAPAENVNYMGSGYASFARSNASRTPLVLVASNFGTLNAFDAASGQESWAYVPHAQLSKMGGQAVYNGRNQTFKFAHDTVLDGPITSTDVYANGAWRTIAVMGQGEAVSDSNDSFYFALDVTDPANPFPLWETTETILNKNHTCDFNDKTGPLSCTQSCYDNGNCVKENAAYRSEFSIDPLVLDGQLQPYGLVEAEDFDSTQTASTSPTSAWQRVEAGTYGRNDTARVKTYLRTIGSSTDCATGTGPLSRNCARVDYPFVVSAGANGTYTPIIRLYNDGNTHKITMLLDGYYFFGDQPTLLNATTGSWQWGKTAPIVLSAGRHVLTMMMVSPSTSIDAIAVVGNPDVAPAPALAATNTQLCDIACTLGSCLQSTMSNADQEWSQCGAGANLKCCVSNNQSFCAPVGTACGQPPSGMGQTLSLPSIGRMRSTAGDVWVAFFASGYNYTSMDNVGRSVYAVEAYTGRQIGQWNLSDIAYKSTNPPVETTVPGGVALVDADADGYVDRLYVGDTVGRMWKINLQATLLQNGSGMISNSSSYPTCVVFDAGNPNGTTSRIWAPVTMTPAVSVYSGNTPNIYFGTGGYNQAPTTTAYKFYSIRDNDGLTACSTPGKTEATLSASDGEWVSSDGIAGSKYYADPLIVDNAIVYFTAVVGDPLGVSPCASSLTTRIFGRAVQFFKDVSGKSYTTGSSVLANGVTSQTTTGAVVTGGALAGQARAQVARGAQGISGTSVKSIYFQSSAGSVLQLATPGTQSSQVKRLRIISWREIQL